MSSTISVDSEDSNLSVLLKHGSTLVALQRKSNKIELSRKLEGIINDPKIVVDNIWEILKELKNGCIEQRCTAKLLRKMGDIFTRLIKKDPNSEVHYGTILEEIRSLKKSQEESSFNLATATKHDTYGNKIEEEAQQELLHNNNAGGGASGGAGDDSNKIRETYKEHLSFLYSFFLCNNDNNPKKIHKRELIHWWMGMELIHNVAEGEKALAELVAHRYLMHSTNRKYYTTTLDTIENFNSWLRRITNLSIEDDSQPQEGQENHIGVAAKEIDIVTYTLNRMYVYISKENASSKDLPPQEIQVAINTNTYTLNAKFFDRLFNMTGAKVVHLGSLHNHIDDYVVMEDMIVKRLKSLKKLKEVRFLSFQGISRLFVLPKSIYRLKNLIVLDLRGCQDLKYLPEGIDLLKKLVHLDLSHCYELESLPLGIAKLNELKILKGFLSYDVSSFWENETFLNIDNMRTLDNILPTRWSMASCSFRFLGGLANLEKLTLSTSNVNFPNHRDLEVLSLLKRLAKLKISWVHTHDEPESENVIEDFKVVAGFPATLKKLELEAASELAALRLLNLISNKRHNGIRKLYIRGGGLSELNPRMYFFPNIEIVRFRYLTKLHIKWSELRQGFQGLQKLNVFQCPNLIFFPLDENGLWEMTPVPCI